jgi:hypothetical protein
LRRRTRNHICIWLIVGGLLNLLLYTIIYAVIGGDAMNGGYGPFVDGLTGEQEHGYHIAGRFILGPSGRYRAVSKGLWVYSFIHSISIWPTQAAIVIATLLLARPHIIATMRESTWVRGPTFIAVAITLTAVLYSAFTIWFTVRFVQDLSQAMS